MSDNKYLKITSKGFENYNGPLSVYMFKDGTSVEPIPKVARDRIAATMRCVEVSENGKEVTAGVAERLIEESAARAPVLEPLRRQTVEEKVEEEVKNVMGNVKPKRIYTEEELDKAIEKGGIAGLREIAKDWNVKNRSIPALRQMVLDSQEKWQSDAKNKEADTIRKAEKIAEKVAKENAPKKVKSEEIDKVAEAAMTGDLSAAISEKEE